MFGQITIEITILWLQSLEIPHGCWLNHHFCWLNHHFCW